MTTHLTTPLWCLLGFVAWTLILLVAIAAARTSQVLSGTTKITGFPAGVPHGGDAYWRLNRAHLNCLENLPIFATVVLVVSVLGLRSATLDLLARGVLGARIGQSLAHISSGGALAINVRFTFFLVQLACIIGFLVIIVRSA